MANADPNKANDQGVTALMKAAQNGHDPCARALLEAKADPNKANAKGFVALMHACQNGHAEVSCSTLMATLALSLARSELQANGKPIFVLSRLLAT